MTIPNLIMLTMGVAGYHGLDADMFTRLVYAESKFDPQAVNGQSVGLCQINLGAWPLEDWVVETDDPYEPYANLMQGAYILAWLMERYATAARAVAAYTLGHGRVDELVSEYASLWTLELDDEVRDYVLFVVFDSKATRFGAWSWRDAIPAPEVRRRTPR